jgi:hypothetical protein
VSSRSNATDTIIGAPVPGRECGECIACCRLPQIDAPELQKPAGVLCPHNNGGGCGIYESRPEICRDWFCIWRRVGNLPDAARPDRCGVMFELSQPARPRSLLHKLYIRGVALNSWTDFDHPAVQTALAHFRQATLPVWLSFGEQMTLAHPSVEIGRCLIENIAAPNEAVAAQVRRWRTIYEKI